MSALTYSCAHARTRDYRDYDYDYDDDMKIFNCFEGAEVMRR